SATTPLSRSKGEGRHLSVGENRREFLMVEQKQSEAILSSRVDPIYHPRFDGLITIYSGSLLLRDDEDSRVIEGDIVFQLSPRPDLMAQIVPDRGKIAIYGLDGEFP